MPNMSIITRVSGLGMSIIGMSSGMGMGPPDLLKSLRRHDGDSLNSCELMKLNRK